MGVRGGLGTQEAGEFVLMDEVLDMLKFGQVVHGAAIYGGVEVNHIWWCLLFQVMDVHGCLVELLFWISSTDNRLVTNKKIINKNQ